MVRHVYRPAPRREHDAFVEPEEPTTEEQDRVFLVGVAIVLALCWLAFLWALAASGVL